MSRFPTQVLSVKDLNKKQILELFKDCKKQWKFKKLPKAKKSSSLWGLLFLEPSTRTRASFEIAAQDLNLRTIQFESKGSSLEKGETLKDMLDNL